jgi:hypothetical protein
MLLKRLVASSSVLAAITLLGACGVSTGDTAETLEAPLGASAPFVLVPTAESDSHACAAELGTTYCTKASASVAAKRCHALTYAADRTTCKAGPTYPTAAACEHPQPDDCSFYRSCLESSHACGDDGYALAYGERLCYAFIEKRASFSSDGQRWLRQVRSCLQKSLVPLLHETATCATVLDEAYATHPACYTAPDNSICSLPASDVLELAGILGNDLLSARARAQIGDVAHTCVLEFFGFSPVREWNASRHEFFRGLEDASASEESLRAFVGRPGAAESWVK